MAQEPVQDSSEFEAIEKLLRSVRPSAVGEIERTFYQAGWAAAVHCQTSSGLAATQSGFRWPSFGAGVAAGVAVILVMWNIGMGWKSFRPNEDSFGPATVAQGTGSNGPQRYQSDTHDAPASHVNADSRSVGHRSFPAAVAGIGDSPPIVAGTLYRRKPWLPGIPDWLWNREDVTKPLDQRGTTVDSVLTVKGSLSDTYTLNGWLEFPRRTAITGLAHPVKGRSPRESAPVLNARPLSLEMLREWL